MFSFLSETASAIKYLLRQMISYFIFLCRFLEIQKPNDFIMMQKNSHQHMRKGKDFTGSTTPAYNSQSHHSECPNCASYEQDIAILQDKLMQTHNKLIEQIDLCREQQVKLIEFMKNRHDDQENNYNVHNVRDGKSKKNKHKRNYEEDYEYQHSVEPLIEAKTQLLRNDLEAMRNKVLTEIRKSNKLQEQNRELEHQHEKEVAQYRDRMRKIEASRNKLLDSNQKLRQQCVHLEKQLKIKEEQVLKVCTCGFQNKYYELDQAFMNQRTIMNQLLQQNNSLQNQVHQLRVRFHQSHQEQRQPKINLQNEQKVQYEIRTDPKKRRGVTRQKKKEEFEQTKNLIKKLEIAQKQIRTRNANEKY